MPRKPKPLEPLDLEVIEILAVHQEAGRVSQRYLARETGMSLNRIGIILRAEGPAPTIGELALLAEALGLRASMVVREAELRMRDHLATYGDPDKVPHWAGARTVVVPDTASRAARTVRERPEHEAARRWDEVGEESQVPADEQTE